MTPEQLVELLKTFGVPSVALIVVVQWVKGYIARHEDAARSREMDLSNRLTKLEDYQREKLSSLVSDANLALKDWAHALAGFVSTRPCLLDEKREKK